MVSNRFFSCGKRNVEPFTSQQTRLPFFAAAWVPVGTGGVAVQVAVAAYVVIGFRTQNDIVADEGPQAAGVGVVGGADVGEGGIVKESPKIKTRQRFPMPVGYQRHQPLTIRHDWHKG